MQNQKRKNYAKISPNFSGDAATMESSEHMVKSVVKAKEKHDKSKINSIIMLKCHHCIQPF